MSPQQKQEFKNITSQLHQWMTIIGFPILIYLVADMYKDFKEIKDNSIRHELRIGEVEKKVEQHQNILVTYILGKR